MKLLIVTQTVDTEDPFLGFFIRWIEEFSKYAEHVEIICLKEGKHALPANVRVHSLGKPYSAKVTKGVGMRIKYVLNFYRYIWKLRHEYDAVFVHMNPEYIVLGGILWHMIGKHIGLWYVHKSVNLKLRLASLFARDIFTASPEGFLLATSKLHVVGHGIDVGAFYAPTRPFGNPLRIVSVGRITPIKNLDTLIRAVALLKDRGIVATATFIGVPTCSSDEVYEASLKELARKCGVSDQINFAGSVPYGQMPEQYRHFDISVNLSPTGGMDKAVLESMAAGLLVFVSNLGFTRLLGPHSSELMFPERNAAVCADKIAALVLHEGDAKSVRADLQRQVEVVGVQALIPRILSFYETSR